MRRNFIISLIFLFTIFNSYIYAHDESIHPNLTEQAAQNTYFKTYLLKYLNFEKGLESTLSLSGLKYNILEWLQNGSKQEDSPMCRASNHFHDPMNTKSWTSAAMSDSPWWINTYCTSWSPYYSDVTWATGFTDPASTPIPYNPDKEKSPNMWANARLLYYNALTATNQATRENNFAQMFKALGQVLHLLQDMSVPAHVRNDFRSHLVFNGICDNEGCHYIDVLKWFGNPFEYYIKMNPTLVNAAGAANVQPTFTNPRLTDFWDTNQYNGDNPSNSTTLGLAEITNSNYFSDNTIYHNNPEPEHFYWYPFLSPVTYSICEYNEMGTNIPRKYVCRNGSPKNPVAKINTSISLLNEEASINNENIVSLQYVLDDNVHDTYANELLPLAIGYSSQVLEYFFRGQLEAVLGYRNMRMINKSQETISDGIFEVYYDNDYGVRSLLTTATVEVLEPGNGQVINLPIIEDVKSSYMVVYKGRVGAEADAVIGKYIPVGKEVIFISLGSQGIIWDVEKNDFFDKATTNSSTAEQPVYANTPFNVADISTWRQKHNVIPSRMKDNASMNPCGRSDQSVDEIANQLCPQALDAIGALDTSSSTGDEYSGSSEYFFNAIMDDNIYTHDRYVLPGSLSSSVDDLNSSVWYRVQSAGHGSLNQGDMDGYYWSNSNGNSTYSFYTVGEPFGEPFFVINQHHNTSYAMYECPPPIPTPAPAWGLCERGAIDSVALKSRRDTENSYYNSAMTKLLWSDKLIFHVTHVAAVINECKYSYDRFKADPIEPFPVIPQPRIQGLKVNLDYKKRGLGDTYHLGYIPAAPEKLTTAIQALINNMYEERGIPATQTTYNVPMEIIFYEVLDE